ncbi:MAG: elongation factor P hydroxylase [Halioglobus sp.]|jgi:elongation factor P hydroxylase
MIALACTENSTANVHDAQRLERVFYDCFYASCNTQLEGGKDEPLYQPTAHAGESHRLYFRADYFASALHEVAHWCIAGAARREQVDYGYWYAPDGRNTHQQNAFEGVEAKPQALEWFFARACGHPFRISADNLDPVSGEVPDLAAFSHKVFEQVLRWQVSGLPQRGAKFFDALCGEFGTATTSQSLHFCLEELSQ